jgi:hypothetical protein
MPDTDLAWREAWGKSPIQRKIKRILLNSIEPDQRLVHRVVISHPSLGEGGIGLSDQRRRTPIESSPHPQAGLRVASNRPGPGNIATSALGQKSYNVVTCRAARGTASGPRKLRTTTESDRALLGRYFHNRRITVAVGGVVAWTGNSYVVQPQRSRASPHHAGRRHSTRFLTGRSLLIDPRLGINGDLRLHHCDLSIPRPLT